MANKKLTTTISKCESCGANVAFDPRTQSLLCKSCSSSYTFEKSNDVKKHLIANSKSTKPNDWAKSGKMLNCHTCGAQVFLNKLELSTTCPYCGSNHVLEDETRPELNPDGIIPFAFDEEVAGIKFKENIKKKFFIPNAFKKTVPRNKVHGVYIPAFAFDVKTMSLYSGLLTETVTYTSGGKTYSTSRSYPISGRKNLTHTNFVVESSSKIDDSDLNSVLPYNMNGIFRFDTNFVRGYSVEHYNEMLDVCYRLAKRKLDSIIRREILSNYSYTMVNHLSVQTTYADEKYSYWLLPIYNFEYEYKKKKYITIMNGQTGKIGSGVPRSPIKITISVLIWIALIVGFFLLVFM